jgi:hypothetical protein
MTPADPETGFAPAECEDAKWWRARFESMRQTYRWRWNEGLSMSEWHEKYCAAHRAAKDMQRQVGSVVALLEQHPNHISAEDVVRMLKPLLPAEPRVAPRCDRSTPETEQERP